MLTWFSTAAPDTRALKKNWVAGGVLLAVLLAIISTRYFDFFQKLDIFPPRPSIFLLALIALSLSLLVIALIPKQNNFWMRSLFLVILFIFILIRIPSLLQFIITLATTSLNRAPVLSPRIQWFGFSYIAFRLLHTIRDRQANRLPSVSLDEYINYIIFFPSLSAGPIDRIQRFIPELRQPEILNNDDWVSISKRIFWGLTKKFIIADTLAVIAIDAGLVQNIQSTSWMWIMLYAYAFQIYFDFSGYTDIAIGTGKLLGISLPENFRAPYLKPNIAQFWNNWHITLTQWFRAYYFNPLTRFLRKKNIPTWLTLITVQLSTMILIGLWHGATWNFLLWGLWHGIGLFLHNRWNDWSRHRIKVELLSERQQNALLVGNVFLTFNFVAIGWVFFALPTPELAKQAFFTLLGIA